MASSYKKIADLTGHKGFDPLQSGIAAINGLAKKASSNDPNESSLKELSGWLLSALSKVGQAVGQIVKNGDIAAVPLTLMGQPLAAFVVSAMAELAKEGMSRAEAKTVLASINSFKAPNDLKARKDELQLALTKIYENAKNLNEPMKAKFAENLNTLEAETRLAASSQQANVQGKTSETSNKTTTGTFNAESESASSIKPGGR